MVSPVLDLDADEVARSVGHRLGIDDAEPWSFVLILDLEGSRFVVERSAGARHLALDRYVELGCLAKPIASVGAAVIAEHHGVALDVPVRRLDPRWEHLDRTVTIGSLLCHDARLRAPSYFDWLARPSDRLRSDDLRQEPPWHGVLLGGRCWRAPT